MVNSLFLFLALAGALPGDTLWLRSFNGPGNREERPTGAWCDRQGNVVVTGYTYRKETDYNFLVLKYDSPGKELWRRMYNSPLNSEDRVWASCLDDSGNIYVTGGSIASPEAGWDYVTIKYRPNGDTAWLRRYDSPYHSDDKPAAIAVDGAGNVAVTGASQSPDNSWDYLTVKYDMRGDTLWTRRLDGVGHGDDLAAGIAFDPGQGLIVTGKSFNESRMPDIVTVSYDPEGKVRWRQSFTGTGMGHDIANSVAVDTRGNAYVAGSVFDFGTSYDYALVKYSPAGKLCWARTYDGPGHRVDMVSALRLDSRGSICVTGQSMGAGTFSDYATVKYDSTGETLWVRRYNSPGNREDRAQALVVDGQDRVYVTGGSVLSGSYESYVTIAYDVRGDTLWSRSYKADGNGDSRGTVIALDQNRGVIVSGFAATKTGNQDVVTIKYVIAEPGAGGQDPGSKNRK
jgi:hypothetical protein